ncbi:MAG: hypothetical protein JSV22_02340 [Bacteroidales bacterium]|nr:MAG: hypothetical protein JSV22_02340 [Bacteroidales bacterium]
MGIKNNIEFIDQEQEQNEVRVFTIRSLFSGSILTQSRVVKQFPYILFLVGLALIYIGNRFHAERIVRKLSNLQVEVKDLCSEQITTASELMNISRPSEVIKLVNRNNIGLSLPEKPPEMLTKKGKKL